MGFTATHLAVTRSSPDGAAPAAGVARGPRAYGYGALS
jgi:hypothetical protein